MIQPLSRDEATEDLSASKSHWFLGQVVQIISYAEDDDMNCIPVVPSVCAYLVLFHNQNSLSLTYT
jgi:hypothetical protein